MSNIRAGEVKVLMSRLIHSGRKIVKSDCYLRHVGLSIRFSLSHSISLSLSEIGSHWRNFSEILFWEDF